MWDDNNVMKSNYICVVVYIYDDLQNSNHHNVHTISRMSHTQVQNIQTSKHYFQLQSNSRFSVVYSLVCLSHLFKAKH